VNLQPTPARLFLLKSDLTVPTNLYMMGLIFACIPPFIIYVLFQRKIMGGMMAGAVKG
jgi:raffinose/stachyose/melibiose transport system permease protein